MTDIIIALKAKPCPSEVKTNKLNQNVINKHIKVVLKRAKNTSELPSSIQRLKNLYLCNEKRNAAIAARKPSIVKLNPATIVAKVRTSVNPKDSSKYDFTPR